MKKTETIYYCNEMFKDNFENIRIDKLIKN